MTIKEQIRKMSSEERSELAVYLRCLELANDESHAMEMDRRADSMRRGESFDRETVLRLHQSLKAETL